MRSPAPSARRSFLSEQPARHYDARLWRLTPAAVPTVFRMRPTIASLFGERIRSLLCLLFHLLGEVHLVGLDVTFPFRNALVAHPDLLGNLVNKPEVVADQHGATRESIDGIGQRVDTLHVQVIRRLVQQQKVWVRQRNQREDHTRLLAVGKSSHLSRLHFTCHTILAQLGPPLVNLQFFGALRRRDALCVSLHEELKGRFVIRKHLCRVLVVLADPEVVVPLDVALARFQVTAHQLDKCGLACPIRPHKGNSAVQVDAEGHLVVEVVLLVSRIRKAHLVESQHRWRQLLGVREPEFVLGVQLWLLCEALLLHLVDDLLFRLRLLTQISVGTARADEFLQVLNVSLLFLVCLQLVHLHLLPSLHVGVVVASPIN
mmetsp:Transcript_11162/g.27770  ORF Transcript_11162/g.27770 Transcript_11162/m.27770 type:complete len:374 (-) Transcript_11162:928-2049(-)